MESGAVAAASAEAGVPFAVMRAVCDPAGRTLPPAALVALNSAGRLVAARLAMSILGRPGQLVQLFGLARDAAAARRALRSRVLRMSRDSAVSDRILPVGVLTDGLLPDGIVPEGIL